VVGHKNFSRWPSPVRREVYNWARRRRHTVVAAARISLQVISAVLL
jgi:hypothetical protein